MMVRLQFLTRHPGTGEAQSPGTLMMQFWSRPSTELEILENIISGDDAAAGANEHSCKQANLGDAAGAQQQQL